MADDKKYRGIWVQFSSISPVPEAERPSLSDNQLQDIHNQYFGKTDLEAAPYAPAEYIRAKDQFFRLWRRLKRDCDGELLLRRVIGDLPQCTVDGKIPVVSIRCDTDTASSIDWYSNYRYTFPDPVALGLIDARDIRSRAR